MLERAQEAGREPAVADADRTNATLAAFFKGVIRPDHPDDQTVHEWLDDLVNQQAENRKTVILDMGGGDQVFKRFARELELAKLMESAERSDRQVVSLPTRLLPNCRRDQAGGAATFPRVVLRRRRRVGPDCRCGFWRGVLVWK